MSWPANTGRGFSRFGPSGLRQAGEAWDPDEVLDLLPPMPDLSTDEARRASWWDATAPGRRTDPDPPNPVRVGDMTDSHILAAIRLLSNRAPQVHRSLWLMAFHNELAYRHLIRTRDAEATSTRDK